LQAANLVSVERLRPKLIFGYFEPVQWLSAAIMPGLNGRRVFSGHFITIWRIKPNQQLWLRRHFEILW